MAVNTTWSDPTAAQASNGLALVTGDTLTQDSWQRTVSNLNALGGTTGRRTVLRREWAKGSDIASASTTDLSTVEGNYVHVTGSTTITAFGTVNAGTIMVLEFDGNITLTHNATSLILQGGENFTTSSGVVVAFVSEGSGNWRELWRHVPAATQTQMEAGTSTTVFVSPGRTQYHPGVAKAWAKFNDSGTLAASYNVTSVTDTGTGDFTLNWTTPFSSANYVGTSIGQSLVIATIPSGNMATGSMRVLYQLPGAAAADPTNAYVAAFGDQ